MARIAAIGLIDLDTFLHLDRHPEPGGSAVVTDVTVSPGGTTANTAVALARLGESVSLRAVAGADQAGDDLIAHLAAEGIDCSGVTRSDLPTDRSTVLLDTGTGERSILWHKGAMIKMGDRLDIATLFGHDVVVLDITDAQMRRFLTDLPAHTRPDVRLLGPITYLVDALESDAAEIAFRFDTIVGTQDQFCRLLDTDDPAALIGVIQRRMPGANLRAAIVTAGAHGCDWVTRENAGHSPAFAVASCDTTGAGDAFVAGVAYGMARRWPWQKTTRFANAVAALSTRAIGAQTALPTLAEVTALIDA